MSGTPFPTPEQMQRAKWDLLLTDQEYRLTQIRALRQDIAWKPWQILATLVAAAAAFMGAGFALAKLLA